MDIDFTNEYDVEFFEETDDIENIIQKVLETNEDDNPFFIVHLEKVIEQYNKWTSLLPKVKPYYAVKCNPNEALLKLLTKLDVYFDCASKNEIAIVKSLDVDSEKIIFANPCKASQQIKFARGEDVNMLVFDNIYELLKIRLYHPNAECIIRIQTNDSKSDCKFNCKFGVELSDVKDILEKAKFLQINVVGVSFHVGSNCRDSSVYYESIHSAHQVFMIAKELGYAFNILDLGGGFPGTDNEQVTFEDIAIEINRGIDDYFNSIDNVRIIAEPGRYFVSSSHTLVTNIIGKKDKNIYYLNDGVYGSFNCIIFDKAKPKLIPYNKSSDILYNSKVFGPTCDSIDLISESCELPNLAIGDWVYVENFGAYTTAAASSFNGFQPTKCVYVFKKTSR